MKFTLGLAILAFTAIVGTYQYYENSDLLEARARGLERAKKRSLESVRLHNRLQEVRKMAVRKGDDQKSSIERLLQIGASTGLEFQFLGQPRSDGNPALYRHSYRIEGPTDFRTSMRLLNNLALLPGFTIHRVCYGCKNMPRSRDDKKTDNRHMVTVEGFLYVYDPAVI